MGTSLSSQAAPPDVDLSGKTIVVTGANTGIGYHTAKVLAQLGSRVIIACRSESKALEAIERMRSEATEEAENTNKSKIKTKTTELELEYMNLDLSTLASTMTFVEAYKAKGYPLHVLVCNAGLAFIRNTNTPDGHEIHFQVNYLSHFLLTLHLLPVLKTSGPNPRIVLVSSISHTAAKWNPDDIECSKHAARYENSKLYQIMQMFSMARRLDGSGISIFSLHPGVVETDIFTREEHILRRTETFALNVVKTFRLFRSPFDGALSTIHAAANPKYEGQTALYFENAKPSNLRRGGLARDKEKQEVVWKYTLECLKDYVSESTLSELTSPA